MAKIRVSEFFWEHGVLTKKLWNGPIHLNMNKQTKSGTRLERRGREEREDKRQQD